MSHRFLCSKKKTQWKLSTSKENSVLTNVLAGTYIIYYIPYTFLVIDYRFLVGLFKHTIKIHIMKGKMRKIIIGIQCIKKKDIINRSSFSFCLFLKSRPAPFKRKITHLRFLLEILLPLFISLVTRLADNFFLRFF